MAIAEELVNILGFKIEGVQNLKRFKDGMKGAADTSHRSAKRMRAIGGAFTAGTAAVVGFSGMAAKQFAGLEREMNRIGITANASVEDTAKATSDVQKLATELALPIDAVVAGLETLVASGMDLDTAMAFLPSVAATAQASGASLVDIANTAQKTASALGLQANQMNRVFDIMVQGGKDGQFELKDMAQYIPSLANSFASLGYEGEEGVKQLIAILQTLREDTGSASAAATQAQNVFGKMYSQETANKFADFGIDIRKEMEAAREAGEGALEAFVRISKEAIDGDLSKLPLLFTDQEFRLGMQSLITSEESLQKFLASLNSAEVDGTVFRDVNRILGDTQATIDETNTQFDRFINNVGKLTAPIVKAGLSYGNEGIEYQEAMANENISRGMEWYERLWFGLMSRNDKDIRARLGGFIPDDDRDYVNSLGQHGKEIYANMAYVADPALPTEAPKILQPQRAPNAPQVYYNDRTGMTSVSNTPAAPEVQRPRQAYYNDRTGATSGGSNAVGQNIASLISGIQNIQRQLDQGSMAAVAETTLTDNRNQSVTAPVSVVQHLTTVQELPPAAAKVAADNTGQAVQRAQLAAGPAF